MGAWFSLASQAVNGFKFATAASEAHAWLDVTRRVMRSRPPGPPSYDYKPAVESLECLRRATRCSLALAAVVPSRRWRERQAQPPGAVAVSRRALQPENECSLSQPIDTLRRSGKPIAPQQALPGHDVPERQVGVPVHPQDRTRTAAGRRSSKSARTTALTPQHRQPGRTQRPPPLRGGKLVHPAAQGDRDSGRQRNGDRQTARPTPQQNSIAALRIARAPPAVRPCLPTLHPGPGLQQAGPTTPRSACAALRQPLAAELHPRHLPLPRLEAVCAMRCARAVRAQRHNASPATHCRGSGRCTARWMRRTWRPLRTGRRASVHACQPLSPRPPHQAQRARPPNCDSERSRHDLAKLGRAAHARVARPAALPPTHAPTVPDRSRR